MVAVYRWQLTSASLDCRLNMERSVMVGLRHGISMCMGVSCTDSCTVPHEPVKDQVLNGCDGLSLDSQHPNMIQVLH